MLEYFHCKILYSIKFNSIVLTQLSKFELEYAQFLRSNLNRNIGGQKRMQWSHYSSGTVQQNKSSSVCSSDADRSYHSPCCSFFSLLFSPSIRQILVYPADAGPSALHTYHHLFVTTNATVTSQDDSSVSYFWVKTVIFPHNTDTLHPYTPNLPMFSAESFFPKLACSAVTQTMVLRHAAAWGWSEP